ncbi:MAG TPA: SAM-dependent methyltransferase [Lentisphaeria bacterium]|jgi:5-histidylcysteine sulfoxide synthase/putative 4-mercaptohistidine N1-methyltranferase|nr:SAM-dependent methyltransferase [Lentisphaeria bacterium]
MHKLIGRSILLSGTDPEQKREELRAYFHRTFTLYERLFETLVAEDAYYERPEPLRHPLIFYYGHTATFFVNKLILAKAIPQRINPRFEAMFAIGVDEMSWDDLNDAHYQWPRVEDVRAYRNQVRELVDAVISEQDLSLPIHWDTFVPWTICMGIEHERIHLETSSVLIRQLDVRWVQPHADWPICTDSGEAPENVMQPVPAGTVDIGKQRSDGLYGWDNEYGTHRAEVAEFAASKYLISNQEFRGFMDAGGYQTPEWWTEEGRNWLAFSGREYPIFWLKDGAGNYRFRTMLQEIEMPWDWPAEVNYLEAKAFCKWRATVTGHLVRLPTEDEWHRLHDSCGIPDQPDWPETVPFNINLEHGASSVPVNRHELGGFCDVIGNVWQWTETPIHGFDGFEVHPLYDDFSSPTFDNQHNLIKGGSWIATGNEATRLGRYAFRRHFFQHVGFRLVEGEELPPLAELPNEDYETDAAVSQYCEFHYGASCFGVPNFPEAVVQHVLDHHMGGTERALDLGCAVGRGTFELARVFEQATGIDFSARFIRQAISLQEHGFVSYAICDEGSLTSAREYTLEDLGLLGLETKVTFCQGDAHNLRPQFSDYDLITAVNLIDRLYEPQKFLESLHERLRPGGTLAITSPYTWLEEYTAPENWLGGFTRDGEAVTTLDALRQILSPRFEPITDPIDVPFVIRETARKHQHTVSHLTLWRRRDV